MSYFSLRGFVSSFEANELARPTSGPASALSQQRKATLARRLRIMRLIFSFCQLSCKTSERRYSSESIECRQPLQLVNVNSHSNRIKDNGCTAPFQSQFA